jgi:hypothetical protein
MHSIHIMLPLFPFNAHILKSLRHGEITDIHSHTKGLELGFYIQFHKHFLKLLVIFFLLHPILYVLL